MDRDSGAEEHDNWVEKFTRETQQRTCPDEKRISELKNRKFKIIEAEDQKEKKNKEKDRVRDLWDTIKWNNKSIY